MFPSLLTAKYTLFVIYHYSAKVGWFKLKYTYWERFLVLSRFIEITAVLFIANYFNTVLSP